MRIAFYDNESGGFPKNGPEIQSGQARACQMGIVVTDGDGKIISEFCHLVKPKGEFTIRPDAQAIHGISIEDCHRSGMRHDVLIDCVHDILSNCNMVVCHGTRFDLRILDIEYAYRGDLLKRPNIENFCTQDACKNMGLKPYNLAASLKHLCNEEITGAHNALADAHSCRKIFFELKRRGLTPRLREAA
jgi:DNA polymerase-3 subunit epsilon